MNLDLSPQEREMLVEMLARELDELGPEIHHADNRDFRHELRDQRLMVRQLLERLTALQPVS